MPSLEGLIGRAAGLSFNDRARIAHWASKEALVSERQLAMQATLSKARHAGRAWDLDTAMDAAYRAVAGAAGVDREVSYYDDDRFQVEWQPAAVLAAEAAAAIIADELITRPMQDLLLHPWIRLTKSGQVTSGDAE